MDELPDTYFMDLIEQAERIDSHRVFGFGPEALDDIESFTASMQDRDNLLHGIIVGCYPTYNQLVN